MGTLESKKLSIIIPVYNEEAIIPLLRSRLDSVLKKLIFAHEVILVNDGSIDKTTQLIQDWIQENHTIILLNLSRNFGHQAAISAGLKESQGNAVVIMDADLQDPPELIPQMLEKWQEGYKIVLAERKSRAESFLRKILFQSFYKIFEIMTDISPVTTGVFGLIDRVVVNHLISMTEHNRYLPGLRHWVGFKQATIRYDRQQRAQGKAKQSLRRLLKYGLDAIFSFSYKPLRLSLIFGFIISSFCFIYGIILTILRILQVNLVSGFTTVAVAIFFLGGIILMSIGIMGEYIGRIYDEVKHRPLFLIASKIHRTQSDPHLLETDYK